MSIHFVPMLLALDQLHILAYWLLCQCVDTIVGSMAFVVSQGMLCSLQVELGLLGALDFAIKSTTTCSLIVVQGSI